MNVMDAGSKDEVSGSAETAGKRDFRRLLSPRHIAFVGGRVVGPAIQAAKAIGYEGEIWVVNPHHAEINGIPCVPTISDLPEAPDSVFLALRKELSIAAVRELAAMGAGGCICHAAGFAEIDAQGATLQRDLVAAAGDMPLVGPNCYGLVNYLDGVALWASPAGGKRCSEGAAIVSQSGNIALNLTMTERSVPMAYMISVGNQAALRLQDFVKPMVDDPRVKAIGLYIEGLDDVPAFSRAAEYALAKGVPIVALKVGQSEIGGRMTVSHTSSLAGPDAFYGALFERLGIVRARSLTGLMETVKLLSLVGPLPGRRLGVITSSGGDAALLADLAQTLNLDIPPLEERQAVVLRDQLQDFATVGNPLDYNTGIWGDGAAQARCFAALMDGPFDASVMVLDYCQMDLAGLEYWDAAIAAFVAAARETESHAAVISTFPELIPEHARECLIAGGVVPLQGLVDAMDALSAAAWYGERRSAQSGAAVAGRLALPPVSASSPGGRTLDEAMSKAALAAFGLPVPGGQVVAPADAAAMANSLGYPVALKAVVDGLAHKTEVGGVVLGLADETAVAAAAASLTERLPDIQRVLVEPMVTDAVAELIVGVLRDPQFGLALVVGAGGVLVELIEDSRTLLLPTDRESIAAALSELRVWRLLEGHRQRPAGDRDAAIDAVLAVARFAEAERARLLELDVNPLLVRPEGKGAVAVDAVVRLTEPFGGDPA